MTSTQRVVFTEDFNLMKNKVKIQWAPQKKKSKIKNNPYQIPESKFRIFKTARFLIRLMSPPTPAHRKMYFREIRKNAFSQSKRSPLNFSSVYIPVFRPFSKSLYFAHICKYPKPPASSYHDFQSELVRDEPLNGRAWLGIGDGTAPEGSYTAAHSLNALSYCPLPPDPRSRLKRKTLLPRFANDDDSDLPGDLIPSFVTQSWTRHNVRASSEARARYPLTPRSNYWYLTRCGIGGDRNTACPQGLQRWSWL